MMLSRTARTYQTPTPFSDGRVRAEPVVSDPCSDNDVGGDRERGDRLVVSERPGGLVEVVGDGDRSAAADELRMERPEGAPGAGDESGGAGCAGGEAGEAEQAAGGEDLVGFVEGAGDVVGAEQVEDVGGEEAVEARLGVGELEKCVAESELDAVRVSIEAPRREFMHVRADVDARVAGVAWEVVPTEAFGESTGAVAELADGVGVREVCMREQRVDRAVLVDRLQVLDAANPVVDATRLLGLQVPRRLSYGSWFSEVHGGVSGPEHLGEVGARVHSELPVGVAQVVLDRLRAEEEGGRSVLPGTACHVRPSGDRSCLSHLARRS